VTAHAIAADTLLGAAVLVVLASALGLLLMHDVYQKVHFVTPISLVAPILVAVAVTVQEGYREATGQTWLAVAILAVAAPFLCHATARAARIRECGDWRNHNRPRPAGPASDRQGSQPGGGADSGRADAAEDTL
jgi:multisubunit Na+/H+ antiporter MnhG subunit